MNWPKIRRDYYENFVLSVSGTGFEFKKHATPNTVFDWFKTKLETKKRTSAQNRALHLYFNQLSDQLNSAGYTFTNFLGIELSFTPELIKESIWKPTMQEMFNIKSTTKLTTEMINQLITVFSKHFGERSIYVEFPNWQIFLNKMDGYL